MMVEESRRGRVCIERECAARRVRVHRVVCWCGSEDGRS
jgi:hypothetical protein